MAGVKGTVEIGADERIDEKEAEAMGLSASSDPLQELLELDTSSEIVDEIRPSSRFKNKWKIRALTSKDQKTISERATHWFKKPGGGGERRTDSGEYMRYIICYGVVNPDLTDKKLLKAHGLKEGMEEKLVEKLLLPGEQDRVATSILNLSGYGDDLIEEGKD